MLLLIVVYWLCLPYTLFKEPTSTILNDKNGKLLVAKIATDGQWRFPIADSVPNKFVQCILHFEDQYFYYHPGFNPVSIARAFKQNITEGKKVSGASTLTMQVIRLSRKEKSRTIFEKFIEIILATRLELTHSKQEILALYTSYAPFGGNVVGLDAAAWRYYGRSANQLSWGETATLAVLPNAPALIYPGKNQEQLLAKRNRLLDKMANEGIVSTTDCELAKEEPLPGKPLAMPQAAPHLILRAEKAGQKGTKIHTTIDPVIQQQTNEIIARHSFQLNQNKIHNAAALVIEVESGNVLAYVGNTKGRNHSNSVDIITAPRSTGSIMKPFLYATMLKDGELLPNMLVEDIPTQIAGYTPKNYDLQYDGAVPAKRALSRSLNVPAVRMLQEYGLERFHYKLQKLKLSTITKSANHYGLSLILGGAEATLWDLASVYTSMARTLLNYRKNNSLYNPADFREPVYLSKDKKEGKINWQSTAPLDAASIWHTYQALVEVNRPLQETGWEAFASARKIAWKTGTSFGYRDGWAIGTTPQHVVAVWVGNADGEGRPGLTGVNAAAPIMFDIFNTLPKNNTWFEQPFDALSQVPVCKQSGHRALDICPIDSSYIPVAGLKTEPCPYHQKIHLDKTAQYRVNSSCYNVNEMIHNSWFVLPPIQEWYYKSKNSSYEPLPAFHPNCNANGQSAMMEFIYPTPNSSIYIPKEMDGTKGQVIFEVAHRKPTTTIFWHLDNEYLGSTQEFHSYALQPNLGEHIITLVDEHGESINIKFEIVE